ncbi:M14 metallopeptidase family protein [Pontibacter silvestris]|uniref:M14 metallopeptidase family protein n=1 Tax=Pontibacter silvestris TaxID=2305183 RepID=A0ABW4WUJ3_9BACT|nr:M14 metallopeptidase family protein [Pontibacter silvestris]MCC9137014.1 M14 family metallopeptidase [Pontibacter silvestris]
MTLLNAKCQTTPVTKVAQDVFDLHSSYKELSLHNRRFKHQDIVPLLQQLAKNPLFQVQTVGKSVEQRDIFLVKAGTGKTKVLLWSQMHGDESTATMALFDLFNFLQKTDKLDAIRQQILENTTLYIVPMLNPDGAERFTRRNALEIDLNRDALRLQSPEAQLLKSLRDSLNPEFGFNLHDQSRLYTVGTTSKPATISFLAPPFDHAQTVDTVRDRAMRTIVGMNEALQQFIPGQVGKYSDEHEPRAFGDNIQKWGTSVILIESGGYKGDPEKQYIRQLNFASLVSALHLIGENGYTNYSRENYYKIPQNERYLFDLVVRNVRYQDNGRSTLLDVGIIRDEIDAPRANRDFYYRSSIQEIGDMSVFYGYEEVNGESLSLVPGKVYPAPFKDIMALTAARSKELLAEGYTTVRVEKLSANNIDPINLPLNVTRKSKKVSHDLNLYSGANFVLKDAKGQVRYAIVNGFVYDLTGTKPSLFHGLVL